MTDKDIKDYCKNCDVEPPAMRFKCPECEHNPNNENNKEQIIISDVDVSRCVHLVGKEACNSMDCQSVECGKNLNCLFKQLAYKTQECERMKYYLNKIRDEELESLDIEWDVYITEYDTTDYSNIITYVEYALGVKKDD